MTKSEDQRYKSDPTRATKIDSYLIDTLKEPNMVATIIVKGEKKRDEWPVYKIPRDEIRLNDANHRFANSKNALILERAKPERDIKNPHEFDMSDYRRRDSSKPDDLGGDVEQIREMIRGNFPVDDAKKGEYFGNEKALKNLMMTRRNVSGGSGQGVHAIVTPDGVLINGNRRECVLEDFAREAVAAGQDPDQFNHMLVAVCPKEITQDDIISMELFEQASRSSLARFSKIDFATAVNELYELKLKLLKTKPKTGEWHDGIVTTISKAPDGVNKQEIIDALNMYEFSKKVLNRIGTLHGKKLTIEKERKKNDVPP